MRVAVFSTKPYDRTFLSRAAAGYGHDLTFFEPKLDRTTARLAEGFPAVCAFVDDRLDNLEAARTLGICTIHMSRGQPSIWPEHADDLFEVGRVLGGRE